MIPETVRAGAAFVLCSFMQQGIQFITVPIFTRILSTEEYGQYSLYQSWLSITTILVTLNLSSGAFNNAMNKYKNDRQGYIAAMQGLNTVLVCFWIILYALFSGKWEQLLGLPSIVIIGMLAEMFFHPALLFWTMKQRYEYKYRLLVVVTLLFAICNPLVGLIAVFNTTEKGYARCLSVSLVTVAFSLVFYIYNYVKGKKFFNKQYWLFALKFNIPLVPHYLSQIVLAQSDRIMISNYCNTSAVAIYSLSYNIGTVMNLIVNSVTTSFTPWVYQKFGESNYRKVGEAANGLLLLIVLIAVIPIAFAPEIILILGSSKYYDAVWVVAPVTISTVIMFLYSLYGNIEFYYEKSVFVMIASLIAAISNVILNGIFIPRYGYIAAGYTTLFSYLMLLLMHRTFAQKICKDQNISGSIYSTKTIAVLLAALCTCAICFIKLYDYVYIRIFIILAGAIIAFLNRNKIKQIVSYKEK